MIRKPAPGHAFDTDQVIENSFLKDTIQKGYPNLLLSAAIYQEKPKEIDRALAIGANPDKPNIFDESPLLQALEYDKDISFRYLLEKGVNPNGAVYTQDSPLIACAKKNRPDCVDLLLARPDLDPNQESLNGLTALHIAAEMGHQEVVESLVRDPRTDLAMTTKAGKTADEIAKPPEIAAIITDEIAHRASPDYRAKNHAGNPRGFAWHIKTLTEIGVKMAIAAGSAGVFALCNETIKHFYPPQPDHPAQTITRNPGEDKLLVNMEKFLQEKRSPQNKAVKAPKI